jgi:predicted transcriptional regulator
MLNLIAAGNIADYPIGPETEMDEDADAYKNLRLSICSEHRRALLFSLSEGKKPLADLKKELNVPSPALIHALRELEGHHLVRQDRVRQYGLTTIGRSAVRKVIDFRRVMEVLTKHEAFWSEHDLSGIPDHIFDQIGSLRDATLITGTPPDIFKAMRRFVELLRDSTIVRLVSPVYIPNIEAIVLDKFVSAESRIELLLTDEVLHHFIDEAEGARLKEARGKYLTLRVLHDDPKLVMVVTDRFMALALYRTDETFDSSSMLTSENQEAIAWSQQLFDHYVSVSAEVTR